MYSLGWKIIRVSGFKEAFDHLMMLKGVDQCMIGVGPHYMCVPCSPVEQMKYGVGVLGGHENNYLNVQGISVKVLPIE